MKSFSSTHVSRILLLSVLGITFAACNLPVSPAKPTLPNYYLVSPAPNSTATPTPFLPLQPTPTSSVPLFPTATGFPVVGGIGIQFDRPPNTIWNIPVGNIPGGVPEPAPRLNQPENQLNILIMGSDQRPYEGGYRTDVLMLVTLNFDDRTIHMTHFPRDLFVYIPGHTMERINTSQARGGFDLTADTFEYNFGFRPDHWAMIRFDGFVSFINTLGGINVNVSQPLTDHRTDMGFVTINPGVVYMDGATALWYVRSRYTTSDLDRGRRQQEVMMAVFDRLMSLDIINKGPDLYEQYQYFIDTNLSLEQYVSLLGFASEFAEGNFQNYVFGENEVTNWIEPYSGAQVLLPNSEAILKLIRDALNIQ